jgi:uncharacterized protein (TIGR00251 family)
MRLSLRVKPNAKKEEVVFEGNELSVKVGAPPSEGKANERVIMLLSDFFSVPKSRVKIIKGETSKHKLVEIEGIKEEESSKFNVEQRT